jgi:GNAT superfamily N-acetyltransferase
VTVDPLARRRGHGRALFEHGVERARGQGRRLREQEPQARRMDTGNAADNVHMIAVNELLGCPWSAGRSSGSATS